MIGFGSIGKGTLPLIERHFTYDKTRFVVIDPEDKDRNLLDERGIRFIHQARDQGQLPASAEAAADRRRRPGLLRQPVGRHLLARHHGIVPRDRRALHRHRGRAVGGLLLRFQARSRGALELRAARNRAGRAPQAARAAPPRCPAAAPIPAWCPGSSSRRSSTSPATSASSSRSRRRARNGAGSPRRLGVKGIHIAERDTQRAKQPKPHGRLRQHLVGRGLLSEGMQPAELGWGTHEKWMPKNGHKHKTGCRRRSI